MGPVAVTIEPWFWFLAALFGFQAPSTSVAISWFMIVFFAVLTHELGHALAAVAFGSKASIRLHAFGGVTFAEKRLSDRRDVLMSLGGPLAGFLAGGIALAPGFLAEGYSTFWSEVLGSFGVGSVLWALINLIPTLPLDGGKVLFGLLGTQRERLGMLISGIIAVFAVVGAALYGWVVVSVLFGLLAIRNFKSWNELGAANPLDEHHEEMERVLADGWEELSQGDDWEAERWARVVLANAIESRYRNRARDLLAWIALSRSNIRDATRQLERSEPPLAARALTWAMVLEASQQESNATSYALQALEVEPSDTSAALGIRLLSHEGRFEEARQIANQFAWSRKWWGEAAQAHIDMTCKLFSQAAQRFQTAFESSGLPEHAFKTACAFAKAQEREKAGKWLMKAFEAGFADCEKIERDPDLADLRNDPEIEQFLQENSHKISHILPCAGS